MFTGGHVVILLFELYVILVGRLFLMVFIGGFGEACFEQRKHASEVVIFGGADVYHDKLKLIDRPFGAVAQNVVLIERVADDCIGEFFGGIWADPDGADLAQIVVIALLKDGIFLVGDHAADIEDGSVEKVIAWIEVPLRFHIDDDRDGVFGLWIKRVKDDVKEVGISVRGIALIAQAQYPGGMILFIWHAFDISSGDDLRLKIGEFGHR